MLISHCNKYEPYNLFYWYSGVEVLNWLYGEEAIIGELDDHELLARLSRIFTLKPVSLDQLQRRTYLGEMLFGPYKPDVYTEMWEVEENEQSRLFYEARKAGLPADAFEEYGRIILFYAPSHPLEDEIPLTHFASNDPLFTGFVSFYKGITRDDLEKQGIMAATYLRRIQGIDILLTNYLGYGKHVDIVDLPFKDERLL